MLHHNLDQIRGTLNKATRANFLELTTQTAREKGSKPQKAEPLTLFFRNVTVTNITQRTRPHITTKLETKPNKLTQRLIQPQFNGRRGPKVLAQQTALIHSRYSFPCLRIANRKHAMRPKTRLSTFKRSVKLERHGHVDFI